MHNHFDFDIPIIQAPTAGGITTPELVAAVSNSGALGSLGAGYLSPNEIRLAIRKIKRLTNKPFNVNLFVPENNPLPNNLSSVTKILASIWSELSDEPFEIPSFSMPSFDKQLQVILEEKISFFSFTFGILPHFATQLLKKQNVRIFGTATTPFEAQKLEQAGVDAIICQGQEQEGIEAIFPHMTLFIHYFLFLC